MSIRNHLFLIFAGVAAAGSIVYGAATAYPVEQLGDPEIVVAPVIPALVRELPPPEPAPAAFVTVDTVDDLQRAFEALNFKLPMVRRGHDQVPRVLITELPDDYPEVEQVDRRKRLFIKTMLPLVLRANEEILADRHRLVELIAVLESGRDLKTSDRSWLERLAERYRTNPGEFATLLRRVDAISPALAMAQSIEESGWGRSRFARAGNALFGQRVWNSGAGLVPKARAAGESFEVRAFDRLIDSVRAYALNLNRHPAYTDYRLSRARQRATEVALDPYLLAETMVRYSERREGYVETLKTILRLNRLEQFETAQLRPGTPRIPDTLTQLARR